uniref:Uncharacterized protein n=1 Tax=Lotus japonicus TaxID=34305 RepID=I3T5L0_LOTJA|nr:unknown [Lotus japonicus]
MSFCHLFFEGRVVELDLYSFVYIAYICQLMIKLIFGLIVKFL